MIETAIEKMKLVTKEILKSEVARNRLRTVIFKYFAGSSVTSKDPNSVDSELRINHIDYISVPKISKVDPIEADEVIVHGCINADIYGIERVWQLGEEEERQRSTTCTIRFDIRITGNPRTKDVAEHDFINTLDISIKEASTGGAQWE